MVSTYVVVAVMIIAVILLIVVYLTGGFSSKSASAKTTVKSATTTNTLNQTTVSTTPARVQYYAVNIEYQYSGPATINNSACYHSFIYVLNQAQVLNGSEEFTIPLQIYSNSCPLTVSGISSVTPGFTFVSAVPAFPLTMPSNSTADIQLTLRTPNVNFYGPLSITIQDK